MSELTFPLPEIGEASIAADPRTLEALINIRNWAAGLIDSTNLKAEGIKTESLLNGAVTEPKLSAPVAALLNAKTSGLAVAKYTANFAAKGGELAQMETTGIVATLPAPTANRVVAFLVGTGATSVKIKASVGQIFGDFINAANEITLTTLQHVELIGDVQETGWLIKAGEPVGGKSWGKIATTGAITGGAGDFTCAKTGTGEYTVTWTTERPTASYAVAASPITAAGFVQVIASNASSFSVDIRNTANELTNMAFSFVALA